MSSKINTAIQTTKVAAKIIGEAQRSIFKTSFSAAKELVRIYKDAGSEAFKIGKKVARHTLDITIENQREVILTSGKAIQDTFETVKKSGRKTKAEKEVTLDDLI